MDKLIDVALIGGLLYVGYIAIQGQQEQQPPLPIEPIMPAPPVMTIDPNEERERESKINKTTTTIEILKEHIEVVKSNPDTRDQTGNLNRELAKQKTNFEQLTGQPYDKDPPVFHTMPVKPPKFKTPVYAFM